MSTKYIQAAMKQAKYEILPDDGTFYGEIPICEGVYANAVSLEACREALPEVLEDWILLISPGNFLYQSSIVSTLQ